jgi:hypothetical protein
MLMKSLFHLIYMEILLESLESSGSVRCLAPLAPSSEANSTPDRLRIASVYAHVGDITDKLYFTAPKQNSPTIRAMKEE